MINKQRTRSKGVKRYGKYKDLFGDSSDNILLTGSIATHTDTSVRITRDKNGVKGIERQRTAGKNRKTVQEMAAEHFRRALA